MSFDPAADGLFFDGKTRPTHAQENAYHNNIGVHKDLFDTISEAQIYLPGMTAEHDEDLLESLVEKGCEDNQIIGHELSKLADLECAPGIMDRFDQTLESSNSSNSLSAAQGLLNLQNIGEHLQRSRRETSQGEDAFLSDDIFASGEQNGAIDTDVNNIEAIVQDMDSDVHDLNAEVNNIDISVKNNDMTERIDINVNNNHISQHVTLNNMNVNLNSNEVKEPEVVHNIDNGVQDVENCVGVIDDDLHTDTSNQIHNPDADINNEEFVEHELANDSYENNMESINGENISTPISDTSLPDMLNNITDTPYTGDPNVPITDHSSDHSDITTDITQTANEISISEPLTEPNDAQYITDSISLNTQLVMYSDDPKPTDLSMKKNPELSIFRYSPKKTHDLSAFIPRVPSRESDSTQSPQPSGIPAVPLSPELFTMPHTKINKTVFLETLLTSTSTSPKMYTSEVTITKQQCEPLNLGKHRKSASPTVTSCTDEIRKDTPTSREHGEPLEKRSRKDTAEIHKIYNQLQSIDPKSKEPELPSSSNEELSPLEQFKRLRNSTEMLIPDPLLVPKEKLNDIILSPSREIPALLLQKPDLRFPEALSQPSILQNPDILVISLSQLESILDTKQRKYLETPKPITMPGNKMEPLSPTTESSPQTETQPARPKPTQTTEGLTGDIDAATSAALNHMLWYQPYINQLECMGQTNATMELLKSYKYSRSKYPDMTQMYNHANRVAGPGGFPMTPQMEYESNRLQMALWQEAVNQATSAARQKSAAQMEAQMKELVAKSSDVQNSYVHSTKSQHNRTQSAARTSPVTHNYGGGCQRGPVGLNPYTQGSYSGMGPGGTTGVPGLQIPYYSPGAAADRRPRSYHSTSRSPTSPYFPNNNYLQSVKKSDHPPRSASSGSVEGQRPKISVKPITNLMDPEKRVPRRELDVGSTTAYAEQVPIHDPAGNHHLWHPLFGNQKGYNTNSPFSWTTVTATGD